MKDDTTSIFAVNVPETRHHVPGIQMSAGKNYKVYREVHDIGQQPVSTRWVVSQKSQGNFKVRLVVRGFQEDGATSADSPTAHVRRVLQ